MRRIAIPALLFSLFLIGCPHEPAEKDAWKKVTSINEIFGTWKGSTTVPIPTQNIGGIQAPASSVGLDVLLKVDAVTFYEILTLDMEKYLTDFGGIYGKFVIWQSIRESMEDLLLEEGLEENLTIETTDDFKIIMTINTPSSEMDFFAENALYAPYINQKKTKLKMVVPAELLGYTDKDIKLILTKQ